jgi:hypothetical protein
MVGWGRCRGVGLGLRVDGDSLIGHLGDISVDVVGSVLDGLGTAVRQSNLVRSSDNAVGIGGLGSVEVGLGVVIGNTVGVSVGLSWSLGLNISWSRGIGGLGNHDGLGNHNGGRGIGGSRGRGVGGSSMSNDGGSVDRVGNDRGGVDSMMQRSNSNMGVGNGMVGNGVSHMMGNRVSHMVGYRVSQHWSSVHGVSSMGNHGSVAVANHMGRHQGGGGCGSQAGKGSNDESLKVVQSLANVIDEKVD